MNFKDACNGVADIFEAAPETWTRGAAARGPSGELVLIGNGEACQWCALGGMETALGHTLTDAQFLALAAASSPSYTGFNRRATNRRRVMYVNDWIGRVAVINMLRRAGKKD